MVVPQYYYQSTDHVMAAGIVLPVFALLFVGVRLWTRVGIEKGQGMRADDWLIIPSTILTVAMGILVAYGAAKHSLGYRTYIPPEFADIPLAVKSDQLTLMSKIEYACTVMFPVILGCIKLSFLAFYRRIFAVNKKSAVNYIVIGLMAIITMWMISFFFAAVFYCKLNFFAIWGSTLDIVENCTMTLTMFLAFCISDFITDIFIISFPVPLIWSLKLSTGKKIATSGIFLLGGVTIAASLTRLVTTANFVNVGFNTDEADEIFVVTTWLYWGVVECSVGVIAACLPTLSFLARAMTVQSAWQSIVGVFSSRSSNAQYPPTGSTKSGRSGRSRVQDVERFDRLDSTPRKPSTASEEPIYETESHAMRDLPPGSVV